MLTGGYSESSREQRTRAAKAELLERLSGWAEAARQTAVDHHYQNYFLSVPIDEQVRHRADEGVAAADEDVAGGAEMVERGLDHHPVDAPSARRSFARQDNRDVEAELVARARPQLLARDHLGAG